MDLRVTAEEGVSEKKSVELWEDLEVELNKFQSWMAEKGNHGLISIEKSAIKAFIIYKLKEEKMAR